MSSNKWITKSTARCSSALLTPDHRNRLKEEMKTADAVMIGAGAGLSASAGLGYSVERFEKSFADFHENTVLPIGMPADFIFMIHWRNIGRWNEYARHHKI